MELKPPRVHPFDEKWGQLLKAELRAAELIITQTRKDFETFDLLERLEVLENELEK